MVEILEFKEETQRYKSFPMAVEYIKNQDPHFALIIRHTFRSGPGLMDHVIVPSCRPSLVLLANYY